MDHHNPVSTLIRGGFKGKRVIVISKRLSNEKINSSLPQVVLSLSSLLIECGAVVVLAAHPTEIDLYQRAQYGGLLHASAHFEAVDTTSSSDLARLLQPSPEIRVPTAVLFVAVSADDDSNSNSANQQLTTISSDIWKKTISISQDAFVTARTLLALAEQNDSNTSFVGLETCSSCPAFKALSSCLLSLTQSMASSKQSHLVRSFMYVLPEVHTSNDLLAAISLSCPYAPSPVSLPSGIQYNFLSVCESTIRGRWFELSTSCSELMRVLNATEERFGQINAVTRHFAKSEFSEASGMKIPLWRDLLDKFMDDLSSLIPLPETEQSLLSRESFTQGFPNVCKHLGSLAKYYAQQNAKGSSSSLVPSSSSKNAPPSSFMTLAADGVSACAVMDTALRSCQDILALSKYLLSFKSHADALAYTPSSPRLSEAGPSSPAPLSPSAVSIASSSSSSALAASSQTKSESDGIRLYEILEQSSTMAQQCSQYVDSELKSILSRSWTMRLRRRFKKHVQHPVDTTAQMLLRLSDECEKWMSGINSSHERLIQKLERGKLRSILTGLSVFIHHPQTQTLLVDSISSDVLASTPRDQLPSKLLSYLDMALLLAGEGIRPINPNPSAVFIPEASTPEPETEEVDEQRAALLVQVVALSDQLLEVLAKTKRQLEKTPVIVRPIIKKRLQTQTGLSMDEWNALGSTLGSQLRDMQRGMVRARKEFQKARPNYQQCMMKLAASTDDVARDAGKFVSGEKLAKVQTEMARRKSIVHTVVESLDAI